MEKIERVSAKERDKLVESVEKESGSTYFGPLEDYLLYISRGTCIAEVDGEKVRMVFTDSGVKIKPLEDDDND